MHIESGTTSWWRRRHLLFIALFLGCAGWFAYDGYYLWPAQNRDWAVQALGPSADTIQVNPRITRDTILAFKDKFDGQKLTAQDLKTELGEPSKVTEKELWFVGPDAYLKFVLSPTGLTVDAGPATHQATDIRNQRILAMGLLGLAIVTGLKFLRVTTTKIVLDDSGLSYNSKKISWEEMSNLRGEDYARKGWADLEYASGGAKKSFRLDSYHIEKFDEIVAAICERKGFPSPLTTREEAEPSAETSTPQA